MQDNLLTWGFAMAACAPLLAVAQPANAAPPKHSPQLAYQSPFADYKPYKDASLADWRELNAKVAGAPSGLAGPIANGMKDIDTPAVPASAATQSTPLHGHPMKGGRP